MTPLLKCKKGMFTIDILIAIIVIGILLFFTLKGSVKIIRKAKLLKVISQINEIKMNLSFMSDPNYTEGIDENAKNFWLNFYSEQSLKNKNTPGADIGGHFSIVINPTGISEGTYLVLGSKNSNATAEGPILTFEEALSMKNNLDDDKNLTSGNVCIKKHNVSNINSTIYFKL